MNWLLHKKSNKSLIFRMKTHKLAKVQHMPTRKFLVVFLPIFLRHCELRAFNSKNHVLGRFFDEMIFNSRSHFQKNNMPHQLSHQRFLPFKGRNSEIRCFLIELKKVIFVEKRVFELLTGVLAQPTWLKKTLKNLRSSRGFKIQNFFSKYGLLRMPNKY